MELAGGVLTTLWLVPGMLLYIAYYFGKQRPGMWYLRFFLTLFPPMVIAAMWLLKSAAEGMRDRVGVPAPVSGRERIGGSRGSVAVPLGIGVFTYCSCAVGLMISVPSLEREHASNVNLAYTSDQIVNTIKAATKNSPAVFINGCAASRSCSRKVARIRTGRFAISFSSRVTTSCIHRTDSPAARGWRRRAIRATTSPTPCRRIDRIG